MGNIGFSEWHVNGQRHRTDGPAIIWYREDGETVKHAWWFLNDQLHRIDGPAEIEYLEDRTIKYQEWWLGGKKIEVNNTNSAYFKKRWRKLVAEWVFKM